jgi:hypothetical protein
MAAHVRTRPWEARRSCMHLLQRYRTRSDASNGIVSVSPLLVIAGRVFSTGSNYRRVRRAEGSYDTAKRPALCVVHCLNRSWTGVCLRCVPGPPATSTAGGTPALPGRMPQPPPPWERGRPARRAADTTTAVPARLTPAGDRACRLPRRRSLARMIHHGGTTGRRRRLQQSDRRAAVVSGSRQPVKHPGEDVARPPVSAPTPVPAQATQCPGGRARRARDAARDGRSGRRDGRAPPPREDGPAQQRLKGMARRAARADRVSEAARRPPEPAGAG